MARIQPWSAAGAENPMVTALPGAALSPVFTLVWPELSVFLSLLEVQAARTAPALMAAPPKRIRRRDRSPGSAFITTSWSKRGCVGPPDCPEWTVSGHFVG